MSHLKANIDSRRPKISRFEVLRFMLFTDPVVNQPF